MLAYGNVYFVQHKEGFCVFRNWILRDERQRDLPFIFLGKYGATNLKSDFRLVGGKK